MQNLLILILATWRISSLLVNENGPFDAFARFRYLVGVRYNAKDVAYGTNIMGDLFACVWCLSFWVGLILMIAYSYYPTQTILACLPFALSTGAIALNRWNNNG